MDFGEEYGETMMKRLREMYARLPVVRELRNLNGMRDRLAEIASEIRLVRADQGKLLQQRMEEYESQLLRGSHYADPRHLARFEGHVYSQFGEDGMIAEILRRIGVVSRSFVEIGVGTGIENNTAYLLLQGWRGWWIEGNPQSVDVIRSRFRKPITDGRLAVSQTMITAENIESALASAGVPLEPDLFSFDIDRNTYWAWAAMKNVRPRVAVIEYNGHFPPDVDWKVDYVAGSSWAGTMYYGASLKALEILGTKLGFNLVGCNLSGTNAFFVRRELCGDLFEGPFTAEKHYEPFRHFLERPRGFRRCFDDQRDFE